MAKEKMKKKKGQKIAPAILWKQRWLLVMSVPFVTDFLQVNSAKKKNQNKTKKNTGNVRTSDLGENLGWI